MEQTQPLEEYRCACGKLLFKGRIYVSLVEIKCKRCANISSFGNLLSNKTPFSFLISMNNKGIIKDLCKVAEVALGYTRNEIIGKPISRICPLVHDRIIETEKSSPFEPRRYEISSNTFMVRDGATIAADSYCVLPQQDDKNSDYYIFSKLK
jgi:phage FluMu protein Com